MTVGGIDIGSRYIKYVTVNNSGIIVFHKLETGHDPLKVCQALLGKTMPDRLIATGYGRHLLEIHADVETITEIKAVARGVNSFFPECRTIIDIGGQDTKVIRLNAEGNVTAFKAVSRRSLAAKGLRSRQSFPPRCLWCSALCETGHLSFFAGYVFYCAAESSSSKSFPRFRLYFSETACIDSKRAVHMRQFPVTFSYFLKTFSVCLYWWIISKIVISGRMRKLLFSG